MCWKYRQHAFHLGEKPTNAACSIQRASTCDVREAHALDDRAPNRLPRPESSTHHHDSV
jgi:hypothetical protein